MKRVEQMQLWLSDPRKYQTEIFRYLCDQDRKANAGKRDFFMFAKKMYGNNYDYSKSIFISPDDPIIVHCNRHHLDIPIKKAHYHLTDCYIGRCPVCEAEESEHSYLHKRLLEMKEEVERLTGKTQRLNERTDLQGTSVNLQLAYCHLDDLREEVTSGGGGRRPDGQTADTVPTEIQSLLRIFGLQYSA